MLWFPQAIKIEASSFYSFVGFLEFRLAERDYSSFASAAKSRFRHIAEALGFVQISGILYARERDGWHEVFDLQSSRHGSDTFYVNYGIAAPSLCPVMEPIQIRDCGLLLNDRLRNTDDSGAFDGNTICEIEESAERVLAQMRKLAIPWFDELSSWSAIAAEYYRVNPIEEQKVGSHSIVFGADFRSAMYGYLLLKAGRTVDAVRWLKEAQRLMSLPVYYTRDGRTVHEKEKFARLQKPAPHEAEQVAMLNRTLQLLESRQV